MFSFPAISITSSEPFVFDPVSRVQHQQVSYLEIQVGSSSADIYVGPWPDDASAVGSTITYLTLLNAQDGFNPEIVGATIDENFGLIRPGWVITDGELADIGKHVSRVEGKNLTFNSTLSTYADNVMTLLPPFSSNITNGLLLTPGLWRSWTADTNKNFLSTPLKFAVSSGTGILNVVYDLY